MHPSPDEQTTFGYFSTVDSVEHGCFGGYLLITGRGRPLEFHCTAPVKPTRAQEILYGPTLRTCLLIEQVGRALLGSATLSPQLVLTDQLDALCLASVLEVPLVALAPAQGALDAATGGPQPHGGGSATPWCDVAGHRWQLPAGGESIVGTATALLEDLARHVELPEPFGRIHEAIDEAQRIGARESDADELAA